MRPERLKVLSIILLFSVAVSALWFRGCRPTHSESDDTIKITVATHWGAGFEEELLNYIAEYETLYPHIQIEYRNVPYPDFLRYIIISHLSGDSPDIYHLYSLWGAQLIDNNILDTPPVAVQKFVMNEYTPGPVSGITFHDIVYGVPTEVAPLALFYRKDFFSEEGIEHPPQTWDELLDIAQQLTRYTPGGDIKRSGFAIPREWDTGVVLPFYSMLWSNGGELFTDSKDYTYKEKSGIEMVLRYIADFYERDITDASFSYATFPRDLFSGRVAMALLTPDWEGQLRTGLGDEFESAGIAPVPRGTEDRVTAGYNWFYAVDSQSEVKEEAWAFIHWLNSARSRNVEASRMGTFLVNLGMLPSRVDDMRAHPDISENTFMLPFLESLSFMRAEPAVTNSREIKTMLLREIEYTALGLHSPGEATERIIERINRLYHENK